MKAPKVRLYIRVRQSDGRYSYLDPAWNRNRTLRAGYALVAGLPEHHPEAVHYLRFLQGDKRVWQSVIVTTVADRLNVEYDKGNTDEVLIFPVNGQRQVVSSVRLPPAEPPSHAPAATASAATAPLRATA